MKIASTLAIAGLFVSSFVQERVPARRSLFVEPVHCKMINGQQRPFDCEFEILTLWFMGKNGEVLGKVTPKSTSIVLPQSKADSSHTTTGGGGGLYYRVSVDFKRINTPSFATKSYTISTATVDYPISPGELTDIKKGLVLSPTIPPPTIRPNRIQFQLHISYYNAGGQLTINAPVKYLHIANPITFPKKDINSNQYRDRAEAWIAFYTSVDFKK